MYDTYNRTFFFCNSVVFSFNNQVITFHVLVPGASLLVVN